MEYDFTTEAQRKTEKRFRKVINDFAEVYPKAPNATRAAIKVAEINGITREGVLYILKRANIYKTNGNHMPPTIVL